MKILNFEDNVFKHHDISKTIKDEISAKIDQASNFSDGIELLQKAYEEGNPYDLIITDMWFPEKFGDKPEQSGELLIKMLQERNMSVPVIMCSSINYQMPGIFGSVHYSENENWEIQLLQMVKKLK